MPAPTKYGDSTKYMEWSLDAAEVPVNDTNVGCCFTLDAAAVAACTRADGLDCVVTLADGTLVVREMRNFSKANSTGILWFQIPAVSTVSGGTTLYIQLGGATVNEANSTAVWANMYGGASTWSVVSHADGAVTDSGTTGNHGTFNGSAAYGTTSQFGYEAIQVAGDSDYTSFPHNANLAGGNGTVDNARTILGWYKVTNYTTHAYIAVKGIAADTLDYIAFFISSVDKKPYHRNYDGATGNFRGRIRNSALADTGTWMQYGSTYSGANPLTTSLIYRQGAEISNTETTVGAYTAMDGDNDVLSVGRWSTTYSSMAWAVFRIGQFVLSANQILGSYNIESQAATNGAFTVGALTDFPSPPPPPPPPPPTPTTDSLEDLGTCALLWREPPNWAELPEQHTEPQREVLTMGSGTAEIYGYGDYQPRVIQYRYTAMDREDLDTLMTWHAARQGRLQRFWLPLWRNEFVAVQAIGALTTEVTIRWCGAAAAFQGYERIFILLTDGYWLTRHVSAAVDNLDGTETLTIVTPWDRDIAVANIAYLGRLLLVRHDEDTLDLSHRTDAVAEATVGYHELVNEYDDIEPGS